jgi:hypothetical protein
MTFPDGSQQIAGGPVPFSYRVQTAGRKKLPDGNEVPVVRLEIFTQSGVTVVFMPADFAAQLAEEMRVCAGAPVVATQMPPPLIVPDGNGGGK